MRWATLAVLNGSHRLAICPCRFAASGPSSRWPPLLSVTFGLAQRLARWVTGSGLATPAAPCAFSGNRLSLIAPTHEGLSLIQI